MSKKTRRKKKPALKASLPKPKAEPIEQDWTSVEIPEPTEIKPTPEPLVTMPSPTPAQDVLLAILKQAPVLPWKINVAYIDSDFRKAYVALLKNLVNMLALPYNVDQAGTLTPK